MLIEFSGPSASGKSCFVKYLLRKNPRTKSVRRSANPYPSLRPSGAMSLMLTKNAHRFPMAFASAYRWTTAQENAKVEAAFKATRFGAEYCLFKGLSSDRRIWLLDQGRLQLGTWTTRSVQENPINYLSVFSRFVIIGNGIVILSFPPEVTLRRVIHRGDIRRAEAIARRRGFPSFFCLCDFQFKLTTSKIRFAQAAGSQVLQICFGGKGEIVSSELLDAFTKNADEAKPCLSVNGVLKEIEYEFRNWWRENPDMGAI